MRTKITHAMIEGLWAHFGDEYFGELVAADSAKMRAVDWALDALQVRRRKDFLRRRGLTIGDTIYLPFAPGARDVRWPPHLQAEVLIHENYHVWQAIEYGGMVYAAGYLGNAQMRAHLEAEALRTNLEFGFWLTGSMPDVTPYARMVLEYGLDHTGVRYVTEYLEGAKQEIRDGNRTVVIRVATEWLERNPNYPGA